MDTSLVASSGMREEQHVIVLRGACISSERQEEKRQRDSTTASGLTSSQCHQCSRRNHCNHSYCDDTLIATEEGADEGQGGEARVKEEVGSSGSSKQVAQNLCLHHPHERLVRFDPAGQAWCDRLDCWDC
jgi:hypothetical protein